MHNNAEYPQAEHHVNLTDYVSAKEFPEGMAVVMHPSDSNGI